MHDDVLTESVSAHFARLIPCSLSLWADHEVLGSQQVSFPGLETPAVVGQYQLSTSVNLDPGYFSSTYRVYL